MSKYPFLSLLDRKLDDAQSIALETTENAVIAAGAGSGKTQVLATRFAWLVLTGRAKADEILTLTFTNKAAAEMYQRIYATLKFYADHEICPELTPEQRQLARNGLSDFANAHVQTLDSYCANIVRQCSNRYGIRPDFSTGSSDGVRDVKRRALEFTLKNATNPGIEAFADPGKLQEFAEGTLAYAINNFTNLTTPKGYFSSKLPQQKKIIYQALNFYLSSSPKTSEEFPGGSNLAKLIGDIYSEFETCDAKKYEAYQFAAQQTFKLLDSVLDPPEDIKSIYEQYAKFSQEVSKVYSMNGKLNSANKILKQIKEVINPIIDSLFAYINQYDSLVALYELVDDFLLEVNTAKRNSGTLSFGDVSELALQVLLENEDIREQEIAAYKNIMIDEFQDNNGKNRDLLYLLSLNPGTKIDVAQAQVTGIHNQIIIKDDAGNITEDKRSPEKLFFVGDEKQSIYKFRGAEVSVFNELTQADENKLVPMTYNYRSLPETVKAFNLLFANGGGIFSENTNKIDYEAYYDKDALKNGTELPELTPETVPFHFRFVNTNKLSKENDAIEDSADKLLKDTDQLSFDIATKIYEMGNANKNWNDFAILARGRTHQNTITKYLSHYNIPYEVDAFKNIFEDGIINDIYNFLRLCVYPSDINAYCAYLCSPFAGVSESSMEIIISHLVNIEDYNFVFNPFISEPEDLKISLTESEYKKYQTAKAFLEENRTLVLQQKLTTTLDTLWNKTGYKYETMLTSQTELAAEHFDMIFELARTCEDQGKTVSWFIDELETLKKSSKSDDSDIDASDVSYPLERNEAVKIMTIHKSKGLQFKHVFICDCTDVSSRSENAPVFFDEENGLSVKPEKGTGNYFCISQKELAKKKELAEFRRLIYVGITRAIDDVYIMGKWAPQGKSYDEKSDFTLFERLVERTYGMNEIETVTYKEGAAFDFVNIPLVSYKQASAHSQKKTMDQIRNEKIQTVETAYNNAKTIHYEQKGFARLKPSDLEKDTKQSSNPTKADSIPGFSAADFGTLVHAYLEAFANGIEPEDFNPPLGLLKTLNKENQKKVTTECIGFTNSFKTTEPGKALLDAKNNNRFYRAEWGFKMFLENTIYTGSLDLIFENADGTYTIVDYKSDNEIDEEKYVGQQNCYRTAAARLLKIEESKIECKLWFMKKNAVIVLKPGDHQ